MSRFARSNRVFFFEEPVFEGNRPLLRKSVCPHTGVHVMTPVLPPGTLPEAAIDYQRLLLKAMFAEHRISNFTAWYYTPMALNFAEGITPDLTIYDCMDELSAFAGAPPAIRRNERVLFRKADLVFTGGRSLFESKQAMHHSVHLFPSSVDVPHFRKALTSKTDPDDQKDIPYPRLGYSGVIDERMDRDLLTHIARRRPDWQIIMLGPVVKIDFESLPKEPNIHYLGMKKYQDLPAYLAGWNVAMLPFALNESTRFISPTKTPEYLAAGRRVVSTPIRDVVYPYGELGLVAIAATPAEFVTAAESSLRDGASSDWQTQVDAYLETLSWDATWLEMRALMEQKLSAIPVVASRSNIESTPVGQAS